MPNSDTIIIWTLLVTLLLLAICLKTRPVRRRQFTVDKPHAKTFVNQEDVVEELENLQEQIKHADGSLQKTFIFVKKTEGNMLGASKPLETEIKTPEEELKVLADIEEKVKQANKQGLNVKFIVKKNVRTISSSDLKKIADVKDLSELKNLLGLKDLDKNS
jgi:hypothetical protein